MITETSTLQEALNIVCGELPPDWQIDISLELDSGWVTLTDPEGDEREFPSNRESMAYTLNDAIEYAKENNAAFEATK